MPTQPTLPPEEMENRLKNLKNRTDDDYKFAGENQRHYDRGQIDILEEILKLPQQNRYEDAHFQCQCKYTVAIEVLREFEGQYECYAPEDGLYELKDWLEEKINSDNL